MVAKRKDNLLSQFSLWSPDEGSPPPPETGRIPPDSAKDGWAATSSPTAEDVTPLLCSSFSSIRSKLVKRERVDPLEGFVTLKKSSQHFRPQTNKKRDATFFPAELCYLPMNKLKRRLDEARCSSDWLFIVYPRRTGWKDETSGSLQFCI